MIEAAPRLRPFLWGTGVFLHFAAPLLFLTAFTQNPYLIQITALRVGVCLAFLILWGGMSVGGSWPRRRTPLDGPLLVFAGAAVTSVVLAYHRIPGPLTAVNQKTLEGLIFLGVNLGVFFLSTTLSNPRDQTFFRRLLLGVAGASAVYALLQWGGMEPLWPQKVNPFPGRPVSTYGNPNFLSTAMCLAIPLVLWELGAARTWAGICAAGGLALVFLAALTATLTRSSYIGALVGLVVFAGGLWPWRRAGIQRILIWSILAGLLVLLWPGGRLSPNGPGPWGRLLELWRGISGTEIHSSWHQRLLLWHCAMDMWRAWPFWGCGWGHFEIFFPYFQGAYLSDALFGMFRTHANNAHTLVLELASQMGAVGLGLGVWLGTVTGRGQWALRSLARPQQALALAHTAGLLAAVVDNVFGNVSLFFAAPGFLFFWVWGQWSGGFFGEPITVKAASRGGRAVALGGGLLCAVLAVGEVRRFWAAHCHWRGAERVQAGDIPTAISWLGRSRTLFPRDVTNAYELGNAHAQVAQWARQQGLDQTFRENAEAAVAAYGQAVAANPGYDEIYFNRARVFYSLGHNAEALEDLRRARLIHPGHRDAALALRDLYTVSGDPRLAALLEDARVFFPGDPEFENAPTKLRP